MLRDVQYRYHYNVIELGAAVSEVIERAILHHMRPTEPTTDGWFDLNDQLLHAVREEAAGLSAEEVEKLPPWRRPKPVTFQVDPQKIAHILEHLIHSFELDHSYSVVVMNPRKHLTGADNYGYRVGFSDAEIRHMNKHPEMLSRDEAFKPDKEPRFFPGKSRPIRPEDMGNESEERYIYERADLHDPLQWKVYTDKAEMWAEKYLEEWDQKPLHADFFPPEISRLHFTGVEGLHSAVQQIIHAGNSHDKYILEQVRTDKFVQEECLVDSWVASGRLAFMDISAGPFQWGPVVGGEGVRTPASLPSIDRLMYEHELAIDRHVDATSVVQVSQDQQFSNMVMEREILLEEFEKACWDEDKDEMIQTEPCKVLLNDIDERDEVLEKIRNGDTSPLGTILGDENAEAQAEMLAADGFMAHLGDTLRSLVHHTFTPAIGDLPEYADRVVFHVFLISDHMKYKPGHAFQYPEFKRELNKLKAADQEFHFTFHKMAMDDDPQLAVAYAMAMRSAAVPTLRVNDKFVPTKRAYLDSAVLKDRLAYLRPSGDDGPTGRTKHIPIFVFSVDFRLPLFIDKYHQAKNVDGVVLVVQSTGQDWESHLQCNNRALRWNLRKPTKPALAATAEALAGIVPAEVGWSRAHDRMANNWHWAVGENPLSATSYRHNFSHIHADVAQRNYIVAALHRSTLRAHDGIRRLKALRTTVENFDAVSDIPFLSIRERFWDIEDTHSAIVHNVGMLEFGVALGKLEHLNGQLNMFEQSVGVAEREMEEHQCGHPPTNYRNFVPFSFALLGFCILPIVIYLKPTSRSRVHVD